MRVQLVLVFMIVMGASAAVAAASGPISIAGQPVGQSGGQPASLDVLGSSINNTTIIIPEGAAVEVDIVGSSASNLQIGSQTPAPESSPDKSCDGCGACGEEKCYSTPWDDFTRPLCYPWSSYIPTRYNRPFIRGEAGHLGR